MLFARWRYRRALFRGDVQKVQTLLLRAPWLVGEPSVPEINQTKPPYRHWPGGSDLAILELLIQATPDRARWAFVIHKPMIDSDSHKVLEMFLRWNVPFDRNAAAFTCYNNPENLNLLFTGGVPLDVHDTHGHSLLFYAKKDQVWNPESKWNVNVVAQLEKMGLCLRDAEKGLLQEEVGKRMCSRGVHTPGSDCGFSWKGYKYNAPGQPLHITDLKVHYACKYCGRRVDRSGRQ